MRCLIRRGASCQLMHSGQTDAHFHTYSQFASMSSIPPKPTEEELRTEAQLEELLDRVSATVSFTSVDPMSRDEASIARYLDRLMPNISAQPFYHNCHDYSIPNLPHPP